MSDKTRRGPRIARRPEGLGSHTAILIGASVAAIAACAKIGEDVFDHETGSFDDPIRAWVLAHQVRGVRQLFLVIARVGAPMVVLPATGVVGAWLWRRRGLPIAGAMVLAPALATGLFNLVKVTYRRERPAGGARLGHRTFSFPSGHSTAAAAVFPTLAYILWREELMSGRRALALSTVSPLAIGASRVYLDVHWATDVLGGWSVGTLVAALGAVVYERVRRNTREHGRLQVRERE